MDVAFVKGTPPAPDAGATYINIAETISAGVNPQRHSDDTSGEITWLNNVPANGMKNVISIRFLKLTGFLI